MTSTTARAAVQARIDNALDAMPPGARARTEIDVHVPLWALRDLLASEKHPEPDIPDASPGCPACGHAIAEHHGRWCRVPTGAVSRRGSALICSCEAVDAAGGER